MVYTLKRAQQQSNNSSHNEEDQERIWNETEREQGNNVIFKVKKTVTSFFYP